MAYQRRPAEVTGFTLIELSIVLVVIGLVVGGILTGQSLIDAAGQRATLAQLEKYNTAVNTFYSKYGYLPGDIPNPPATSFGFASRGSYQGEGDGDGRILSNSADCNGCAINITQAFGEVVMFWADLSKAGLIDGSFTAATSNTMPGADITGAAIGNYLPQAKIGQGNYIYVYTGGGFSGSWYFTGLNYYGISAVSNIAASSNSGKMASNPGLSVQQAYNMDKKVDDGLPQSGRITAVGINNDLYWTDARDITLSGPAPNTAAVAGSAATCMDNGNVAGTKHYSIQVNSGSGLNCALSFQQQGAGNR